MPRPTSFFLGLLIAAVSFAPIVVVSFPLTRHIIVIQSATQGLVQHTRQLYIPGTKLRLSVDEEDVFSSVPSFSIRSAQYGDLTAVSDMIVTSFYKKPITFRKLVQLAELNRLQQNFPYADQADTHQMYVAFATGDPTSTNGKAAPTMNGDQAFNRLVGFVDVDIRPPTPAMVSALSSSSSSSSKSGPKSSPGTLLRPYLSDLCVHPDFRRQGIAQALVGHAESFVCSEQREQQLPPKNISRDRMHIRVEADNDAAIQMYVKLGYQRYDESNDDDNNNRTNPTATITSTSKSNITTNTLREKKDVNNENKQRESEKTKNSKHKEIITLIKLFDKVSPKTDDSETGVGENDTDFEYVI